jgi:hypothetical protein
VTDIRPEIVTGVLAGNELATEYATWAEQREALRITALRGISTGQELLARLGFRPDEPPPDEFYHQLITRFVRSPNVKDATFTEAVLLWRQAVAYDSAMRLLVRWWPQVQDRTLGEMLQVIPTDVADEVLDHLRRASFPDLPDCGS